jgi:hypothetical protein
LSSRLPVRAGASRETVDCESVPGASEDWRTDSLPCRRPALPSLSPDARRAARALSLCTALAAALAGCSRHGSTPPPAPASVADAAPAYDAPRELVGVWTSTRGSVMRCIELHADGGYRMVPNSDVGYRQTYHGTWRIVGEDIIWRDASQGYATDTNQLVDVSDGHFKTVEADRSLTQFDRLVAGPNARCPS